VTKLLQDWQPRWGYKRANGEDKNWLIEIPRQKGEQCKGLLKLACNISRVTRRLRWLHRGGAREEEGARGQKRAAALEKYPARNGAQSRGFGWVVPCASPLSRLAPVPSQAWLWSRSRPSSWEGNWSVAKWQPPPWASSRLTWRRRGHRENPTRKVTCVTTLVVWRGVALLAIFVQFTSNEMSVKSEQDKQLLILGRLQSKPPLDVHKVRYKPPDNQSLFYCVCLQAVGKVIQDGNRYGHGVVHDVFWFQVISFSSGNSSEAKAKKLTSGNKSTGRSAQRKKSRSTTSGFSKRPASKGGKNLRNKRGKWKENGWWLFGCWCLEVSRLANKFFWTPGFVYCNTGISYDVIWCKYESPSRCLLLRQANIACSCR